MENSCCHQGTPACEIHQWITQYVILIAFTLRRRPRSGLLDSCLLSSDMWSITVFISEIENIYIILCTASYYRKILFDPFYSSFDINTTWIQIKQFGHT